MRRCLALFLLLALLVPAAVAQTPDPLFPPDSLLQSIRPEAIRAHMAFLADDLLEGRSTGTRGFDLAALYIKAQFEQMGLKPAGDNGTYFQNVRFRLIEFVPGQSSFIVERDGKKQALTVNQDFAMRGDPLKPDSSVEAPVVFVGFGVTAPEFNYDDYAGADVRGKIVLAFYGAPPSLPSAPGAQFSDGTVKLRNAAAHGAVGFISIWAGKLEEHLPFASLIRFYQRPSLRWLDAKGVPNDVEPQIAGVASINKTVAEGLFAGSGKTFQEALSAALASRPQHLPLPVRVSLRTVSRYSEVQSPNIAAILPGSDPRLRDEYVAFTAHADHLGIGVPVNGDPIYNGAGDNASGTAALLEMAHAFRGMPTPPRRSLLFVAVTGEEENLLGSDYYAHYPTVPVSQIVANVNMDEIALLYDFKDIVALGAEHSSLGVVVDDVARHMGLQVSPDPAPEEVYFVRSDQYSFVKRGIPAVYIGPGDQAVDPKVDGKKLSDQWEATRYHEPSDDMNQPLDFEAAAKSTRVNLAVGYEVAQQTERPHWNSGDFFQRFAAQPGGN